MILVDSTVWIDLIAGSGGTCCAALHALISDNQDICLTDINVMEITRGIRDDLMFDKVRSSLLRFPILTVGGLDSYVEATRLYRKARRGGVTINSTYDCLIAQIALENGASILSDDQDFARLAKFEPALRIADPEAILTL